MKLSRVHPGEWLTGLLGLALLAGLLLPWSEGTAALASPGLLGIVLLLIAAAALLLPFVVAGSTRSDAPIVFETTIWTVTLLLAIVMLVKVVFPPDGGFETGFWLALAGTVLLSFTLWRCVARQT